MAERWNGSVWSVQPTLNLNSIVKGVSCASPTTCTAVGTWVERWTGISWSIQPTLNPNIGLQGVSCSSRTACTAVGLSYVGSPAPTLVERWNGKRWSIQPTPNPIGSYLEAVSCASPTA